MVILHVICSWIGRLRCHGTHGLDHFRIPFYPRSNGTNGITNTRRIRKLRRINSRPSRIIVSQQSKMVGHVRRRYAHGIRKRRVRIFLGSNANGNFGFWRKSKDRFIFLAENWSFGFQEEKAYVSRCRGGWRGTGRARAHFCFSTCQWKGLQTSLEVRGRASRLLSITSTGERCKWSSKFL